MSKATGQQRERSSRGAGGALRGEILEAAAELLEERGNAKEITLRALGRQVGVTPMMVYRHFDNLEDVLLEVKQRGYADLRASLVAALDAAEGDRLRVLATAFVDYGLAHPGAYEMLFSTPITLPDNAVRTLPGWGLAELAAQVVGSHFDEDVRSPETMRRVMTLWAGLHGVVHLRNKQHGLPWPDRSSQVDDVLRSLADPVTEG